MNRVFVPAVVAAAVFAASAFADSVVMRDGRTVENARVLKVGVSKIEYNVGKRKVLYVVRKRDVAKITYRDGSEDVFQIGERLKRGDGEFRGPGKRRGWKGYDGPPPPDGMGLPAPPDGRGPRHGFKARPMDGVPPPPPPPDGIAPPPPPQSAPHGMAPLPAPAPRGLAQPAPPPPPPPQGGPEPK